MYCVYIKKFIDYFFAYHVGQLNDIREIYVEPFYDLGVAIRIDESWYVVGYNTDYDELLEYIVTDWRPRDPDSIRKMLGFKRDMPIISAMNNKELIKFIYEYKLWKNIQKWYEKDLSSNSTFFCIKVKE